MPHKQTWIRLVKCNKCECLKGCRVDSSLPHTAVLLEKYNKILARQSIEQLINPKINLICFHNKTLLAVPSSKRYLSALLKDYTLPNHLPGSH